jgi:tetratricopeptide (TPR) repeat protein
MQDKISVFTSSFPLKQQVIAGVTIFYEESLEHLMPDFSEKEARKLSLLVCSAQIDPKQAYCQALSWKEEKKNHPVLDNLLTFLHLQNRELKKAEELIVQSYQNYPDYLFAKINYADYCLRKKRKEEIPRIFPTFELSKLFPNKSSFHVSEFRGFMIFLSRYHRFIGEKKEAQKYYEYAYAADPTHPSVVFLEKELSRGLKRYKSLLLFLKFFRVAAKNSKG